MRKDGSARDRLRAERVCRAKALAPLVAEREGVRASHVERLEERDAVVVDEAGRETASGISKLLQVTETQVRGIANEMPVVGRWSSADGEALCLSIGAIVDREGKRIDRAGNE